MSYEGYTEYLCAQHGHHFARGDSFYEIEAVNCPVCGSNSAYYHNVDQTNGYVDYDEESRLNTGPADKTETGFTDTWHVDHYGNKYATKHPTFSAGNGWRKSTNSIEGCETLLNAVMQIDSDLELAEAVNLIKNGEVSVDGTTYQDPDYEFDHFDRGTDLVIKISKTEYLVSF